MCECKLKRWILLQGFRPTLVDLTAETLARKQAERRRRWNIESVPLQSRNDSDQDFKQRENHVDPVETTVL